MSPKMPTATVHNDYQSSSSMETASRIMQIDSETQYSGQIYHQTEVQLHDQLSKALSTVAEFGNSRQIR